MHLALQQVVFVQQISIKSVIAFKGQAGLFPQQIFFFPLHTELHTMTLYRQNMHLPMSVESFYDGVVEKFLPHPV